MASRAHQNLPVVSKGCLTFGMLFGECQRMGIRSPLTSIVQCVLFSCKQFKVPYSIAKGHKQQLFVFNSASQLMFRFFYKFVNTDQIHYELKASI